MLIQGDELSSRCKRSRGERRTNRERKDIVLTGDSCFGNYSSMCPLTYGHTIRLVSSPSSRSRRSREGPIRGTQTQRSSLIMLSQTIHDTLKDRDATRLSTFGGPQGSRTPVRNRELKPVFSRALGKRAPTRNHNQ